MTPCPLRLQRSLTTRSDAPVRARLVVSRRSYRGGLAFTKRAAAALERMRRP